MSRSLARSAAKPAPRIAAPPAARPRGFSCTPDELRSLARVVLERAKRAGADGCDCEVSEAFGLTVTVRKDPSAWKGTVAETLCDLDALPDPKVVFDGPVREGARLYPQNVNISAAAVGRHEGDTHADLAVMAVTTDVRVPDDVVAQIAGFDGFVSGRSLSLD